MTYGIHHDNGVIKAISRFEELVPSSFVEITKSDYEKFLAIILVNNFVTYNAADNELEIDQAQQAQLIDDFEKNDIKGQLRQLSIEIDLLERMSKSTSVKQAEFDALLVEYNRP